MSTYIRYPAEGGGGGIDTYATVADLPLTADNGTLAMVLDTDTLYVYDISAPGWLAIGSPNAVFSIGTLDAGSPSANGAHITSHALVLQSASATMPGLVNTTTQTLAGNKTFSGTIAASNLSGTNTGDVTLATIGSSPANAGASISGQVLTLQPADATHGGVVSTTTQSFAGDKTFTGAISASNLSGTNTGDEVARTYLKFVDATNGSDSNTGSFDKPFQTIQAAATALGSVASSATYVGSRVEIDVAPGTYTETLALGTQQYYLIRLNGAKLVGNITWTSDLSKIPVGPTEAKLVIQGTDLRSMYTGSAGVPLVGVDGNITVTTSSSFGGTWKPHVHLIDSGVSGSITFDTATTSYQGFVFVNNGFILTDTVVTAGKSLAASLYAWNADSSTSKCLGGTSGAVTLAVLDNVIFNRPVVSSSSGGGGRWFNVNFQAAAHNLTGYSGTIRMDANSYETYRANVPTKGSETVALVDNATGVAYTPTTPANWTLVPTVVQGALDSLAAITSLNTTDVTLAAVGSSPSANGASLSGQVLTLQPADATHPGLVTILTQSFAGAKTFTGTVTVNSVVVGSAANTISGLATIVNSGTLTLPTSTDTLVGKATTDVLTNKSLSDTTTLVVNASDATKTIGFDCSGSGAGRKVTFATTTASTDKTITIPNLSSTMALTGGSQTFSSKTLVDSCVLADVSVTSKTMGWDLSGATTSTKTTLKFNQTVARTVTFPDATGTVLLSTTLTAPTVQKFTSGSGTYTLPSSPRAPLYIKVTAVGGGGGGAGTGTSPGAASDGGDTTFGSSLITGAKGVAGTGVAGGAGGAATATGLTGITVAGAHGQNAGQNSSVNVLLAGGGGGSSALGGAGEPGAGNGGGGLAGNAAANSGSGGGGAGAGTAANAGGGGGAGGYISAIITSPASSYAYAVGTNGGGGTAGTGGAAGGNGAAGVIIVEEFYQ